MKKTDIIASIMELYNSAVNAWEGIDDDFLYEHLEYEHPVNMVRKNRDIYFELRKDFNYTAEHDGKTKRLERHTVCHLIELENYLDWLIRFYKNVEV